MTLDPPFFREIGGQFENKALKAHKPKKMQSYAIKETSGNEKRETSKCPICEGQHDIKECTTILEQTAEDRSKTIYKKHLCDGCLERISKEHNAKNCSIQKTMQYYTGSKLRKRNQRKKRTKRTGKSQDGGKCASINTGSTVISMCTVPVKIKGSSGNKKQDNPHICTFKQLQSRNFYIRPIERSSLYPRQRNISHHQNDKW